MRISDSPSLQRIDAAYSLPFLSACAAALSEQGLLSELEADALRLSLKERHRRLGEGEASLFADLLAEGAPLIHLLQARCGASGLSQLFMAWTTAQALERSSQALERWAESLLKKAELMFNQEFYIFQDEKCERRTLFSFFLVECAEQLYDHAQSLTKLGHELQFIAPHSPRSSDAGRAWEESLSQHLGFRPGNAEGLGLNHLHQNIKHLYFHLDRLGDRLTTFSQQLSRNMQHAMGIDQWQVLLEDWQSQLAQLSTFDLIHSGSLERLEKKRLRLLSTVLNFNQLLEQQQEVCAEILKISHLHAPRLLLWPQVERREVLIHLVVQGVALNLAEMAVQALEEYCEQHQVAAHQLLASELGRIHPQLNEGILPILQKLAKDRHLGSDAHQEKQTVLQRKVRLMQTLTSSLSCGIALLLFMACGVKTAPRSEVLDLRPAVPYHANQSVRPPLKDPATTPPPQ